jgi:catechol 2,3-dioxygenase-like lactoylglutathione lyase family enzyme
MRITELSLDTQNLQEQLDFYTNILGLPLKEKTLDTFTVQTGTTRLTFRETTQATLYHFAFTIPSNKLASGKAWLTDRVPLLSLNGQDEFGGESWNSGSLYFRDPANHILEFIVHYDLHNEQPGSFGPADLLYISEIGMAFDDVADAVKAERAAFQIEPYRNSIGEVFAAVGDISGLFITVKIGRNWFPTDDSPAPVSPVDVTIEGVEGRSQQLAPFPYHVTVK